MVVTGEVWPSTLAAAGAVTGAPWRRSRSWKRREERWSVREGGVVGTGVGDTGRVEKGDQ